MYDLQIKKGGKLVTQIFNHFKGELEEKEVDYDDLNFHMDSTICLENGVILKDIFLMLKRGSISFSWMTCCPFIEELIEEALAPVTYSKSMEEGLCALLVGWIASVDDECGLFYHAFMEGKGVKGDFSLSFIPLNEIATLPVLLNRDFIVRNISNKDEVVFEATKYFSLYAFVNAFMEELACWPPFMRSEIEEEFSIMSDEMLKKPSAEGKKVVKKLKRKDICKACKKNVVKKQTFGKPKDICTNCFNRLKTN